LPKNVHIKKPPRERNKRGAIRLAKVLTKGSTTQSNNIVLSFAPSGLYWHLSGLIAVCKWQELTITALQALARVQIPLHVNYGMTKIIVAVLGVLAVLLGVGLYFGLPYLNIASSYAAKTMCSGIFISNRSQESMLEDLYAVSFTTTTVDEAAQSVSASVFGLAPATAIFRDGMGCSLVNELTIAQIRAQPSVPSPKAIDLTSLEITKNRELEAAIQTFFEDETLQTRAVLVMHKGKIISERYATGFSSSTPLLGWSMTKSVTNAMIGMLVQDGKLEVAKPAPIEEWQSDSRKDITLDQLLRMSSGLAFLEDYSIPSDATQMLFRKKDAGAYAIGTKLEATPNSKWSYSSGTSNILQEIIRRQFPSHAAYLAFPHERLFQKLGMNSAVLETDASGTYVGSSFMYATARDWAKFGQFFLQDGVWNNERLLPEGWIKYSSTVTPFSDGLYAAHWWVNKSDAAFPQDAFMAQGFEGQNITVVPSKDLVLVRLGLTHKGTFDDHEFVKRLTATIK
jgi:CubicO group peptidase (beta-lactamase class C family)